MLEGKSVKSEKKVKFRKAVFILYAEVANYKLALFAAIAGIVLAVTATKIGIYEYMLPKLFDEGFIASNPDFIHELPYLICTIFPLIGLGEFLSKFYMGYIGRSIVCAYRKKMLTHMLHLPVSALTQQNSSTLLSKVNYDSEQVALAVSDAIKQLLTSLFSIVAAFVVMFRLSPQVTLIVAFVLAPLAALLSYANYKIRKYTIRIQRSMADLTKIATEVIRGNQIIKMYNGYLIEQNKIVNVAEQNRRNEIMCEFIIAVSAPVIQLAGAATLLIFLMLQFKGYISLKPGQMLGFFGAMYSLLRPTKILASVNGTIQKGIVAINSIRALLDEAVENLNSGLFVPKLTGDIKIQHLNFSYNTEHLVINNLNLHIKPGQTVAIVGSSGSGKSSLINLLTGMNIYKEGQILLDDREFNSVSLASIRRNIAIVSQDIFLFDDTIAYNIAYGQNDINMQEIIAAAKAAYIHDYIMSLPLQYETIIGENGSNLSGGQKQRLAIARALIKNAPILILDEATSALDNGTEQQVQLGLDNLRRGKTTIVITHRLSTVEKADQILVLQDGSIVEHGTHEQLLNLQGRYTLLNSKTFA